MSSVRGALVLACAAACLPYGAAKAAGPDTQMAALQRFVELQQRGTPDYETMEPALRERVSRQSAGFVKGLRRLGKLQSLRLMRTNGAERIYELWFEHGRMIWGATIAASGKFSRVRAQLREH